MPDCCGWGARDVGDGVGLVDCAVDGDVPEVAIQ
jgi:hypothetical protein